MKNIIDQLIDKIKIMQNPTVIGLDPRYEMLPKCVKEKYPETLEGVGQAIIEYNKALIDEICDIIPAIKPQIAFYEMYGIPGMQAFKETCEYAKQKGMFVIADIKRGDIGSTAQGYSNAYLGKTKIGENEQSLYDIDFVTVNPYMGTDCVKPFIEDCKKYNKGLFILVKTSNPSSGELQDVKLESGEEVYTRVAKQGGKAEDIALGFDENGLGGIVNASRSLMCAYKSDIWKNKFEEKDYAKATRAEALRMKEELCSKIKIK